MKRMMPLLMSISLSVCATAQELPTNVKWLYEYKAADGKLRVVFDDGPEVFYLAVYPARARVSIQSFAYILADIGSGHRSLIVS